MMKRTTKMNTKSFEELIKINNFMDRLEYLSLKGKAFEETFGSHRYINQRLYKSDIWKRVKRDIILRDNGCDLSHPDCPIYGSILIHHINPITLEDIINNSQKVFDPNNLICVTHRTHNAIHYGYDYWSFSGPVMRTKNDQCPWR